jgi:uncharacterized protein YlxW (UPF0749 family)
VTVKTPPRPDASMSLLTSIMEQPLDPSYAAAAERRRKAGLPAATGARTPLLIISALVVGLTLAIAAATLRGDQSSIAKARTELIKQINLRRAMSDERASQVRALQAEVAADQRLVLAGQDQARAAELATLEAQSGAVAVHGPGIVLTIDDAPSSDPAGSNNDPRTQAQKDEGRVLARDLQIVTNSLWEAGAEAMSINGQRLTTKTAIRFAGDAILVNFRPLVRPYVIRAIGDPKAMPVAFASGSGGAYLRSLQDNFQIRVESADSKDMVLPAATALTVQSAEIPSPTSTQQPQPSTSDSTRTETSP